MHQKDGRKTNSTVDQYQPTVLKLIDNANHSLRNLTLVIS
nr:MAG TPA: hypothetical protein [Caudoviricetes sp.]